MAARSSGIFPREGFNLDNETEITTAPTAAAVTLAHAKTIRVIAINVSGTDLVATIGGQEVALSDADADHNGVVIAHLRGALCADEPAGSACSIAGTATNDGVYLELVDGPRR